MDIFGANFFFFFFWPVTIPFFIEILTYVFILIMEP